jgi:hypothetical protein
VRGQPAARLSRSYPLACYPTLCAPLLIALLPPPAPRRCLNLTIATAALACLLPVCLQEEGEEDAVLTLDEVQVIQGALDMASKTAESAMTPLDKVGGGWGVTRG